MDGCFQGAAGCVSKSCVSKCWFPKKPHLLSHFTLRFMNLTMTDRLLLLDPAGRTKSASPSDQALYASYVMADILSFGGDVKEWWKRTWLLYKGITQGQNHTIVKQGEPHFWKPADIKQEYEVIDLTEEDIAGLFQDAIMTDDEIEIIDLTTVDSDVSFVDLTEDD